MSNKKAGYIGKTISVLTIITILSKLLGLLREIGIGSIFGVGMETDAFYLTLVIPSLLFVSIGVAIQNLFIIEFTKIKEKGNNLNKQSLVSSNMSNIMLLVSAFIFIISFIFAPTLIKIIAPGFKDPEKFNLSVKLLRILLPTIVFIPIYQIKASILKVYDRFVTVSIIDLFFNIFQIGYLLLFSDKLGIIGLAYSVTLSYLFQYIIISIITYRIGIRFRPVLDFKEKSFLVILRLFIPTFISFGVIQINSTVDKILASDLGDGAITALNYGFMLRTVAFSIIVTTILTVVYPLLLKVKNDTKKYNNIINDTLKFILAVTLPITILMIIFKSEIVYILFERGAFTSENTILTSNVLFCYLIGMVFFSLKELFVYVSYTNEDSKTPLIVTTISALLNILLSIVFKIYFGVYGIALGMSVAEIISFTIMIILVRKNDYFRFNKEKLSIIIILFTGITIGILLNLVLNYIEITDTIISKLIFISASSVIYLSIYYIILKTFKINFIRSFINSLNQEEYDVK